LLLKTLMLNDDVDFCFGSVVCRGPNNQDFIPVRFHRFINSWLNALLFNTIHTNATLIRKKCFDGVSFDERLPKFQDTQFHIDLMNMYKGVYVDSKVAFWYVDGRPDQITAFNSNVLYKNKLGLGMIIERYRGTATEKLILVRILSSSLNFYISEKIMFFDRWHLFALYFFARLIFLKTK